MNYKAISLAAVAAMLIGACLLQNIEPKNNRYHQHEEALPKAVCTDHGEDVFCTHLPLMAITTDGPIPEAYLYDAAGNAITDTNGYRVKNRETVSAVVKYFDHAERNNHLSDEAVVSEKAQVRVRGNMSRDFDKKGYAIAFKEEDLLTGKDVSLSGMTADSDWVLHGPFMDKTLLRNYLCYNLSGEIMEYAPNVRFCELFVNEEYMGVYLLTEKIKYNENGRLSLSKTDPDITETSYIVQVDRGAEDSLRNIETYGMYTYTTAPVGDVYGQMEIVYPSFTLTEKQKQYIATLFTKQWSEWHNRFRCVYLLLTDKVTLAQWTETVRPPCVIPKQGLQKLRISSLKTLNMTRLTLCQTMMKVSKNRQFFRLVTPICW